MKKKNIRQFLWLAPTAVSVCFLILGLILRSDGLVSIAAYCSGLGLGMVTMGRMLK